MEAPPATAVPSGTSWRSIAGFGGDAEASIGSSGESKAFSFRLCLCRNSDTGEFLEKAKQLLNVKINEAQMAKLVSNSQYKSWKSAASAFYTTVNETISNATTAEVR